MFSVLVIVLRPDHIAGLGFKSGQREIPLIVTARPTGLLSRLTERRKPGGSASHRPPWPFVRVRARGYAARNVHSQGGARCERVTDSQRIAALERQISRRYHRTSDGSQFRVTGFMECRDGTSRITPA